MKIDNLLDYEVPTELLVRDSSASYEDNYLWPNKEELAVFQEFRAATHRAHFKQYHDWQEELNKEFVETKDTNFAQFINGNVVERFRGLQRGL